MNYRVIVRIEAEIDITDAAVWYERQRANLGNDFLSAVQSAIESAASHPWRYPCLRRRPEVRRVITPRFLYSVFFIRRSDAVIVFRVLHSARDEREWKSTVQKK